MGAETAHLQVAGLAMDYGAMAAVHSVSFSLARGELACLLGPSGCGKTSVLRCIAGFEAPRAGSILLRGAEVASSARQQAPEARRIGMVFQDHALFPHLSAAANIGFGLRAGNAASRAQRVQVLAEQLDLGELLQRYPHELSGGQQQRVALARALAPEPDLLLLDEPFANLDARLRAELAHGLKRDLKAQQVTALLVTHDQDEAFAFAEHIGVMHLGRLLQWDTAYGLYHRPISPEVAAFIGEGVLLDARLGADGMLECALGRFQQPVGEARPGARRLLVRPDDLVLDAHAPLRAQVTDRGFRGAETLYRLRLPGGDVLLALAPSHQQFDVGSEVGIQPELEHVVSFALD